MRINQNFVIFYVLFLSFSSFVTGDDQHLICKQVENIFDPSHSLGSPVPTSRIIQGRAGKRGQIGPKGEPGIVGPPGPPASVDYVRIEARVLESVSTHIDTHTSKVDALSSKIDVVSRRLAAVEKVVPTESCHVLYNGKCFRAILHNVEDVRGDSSAALWENVGWKLANIYDVTHYEKIASYLRRTMPASRTISTAWLGMTFNQQTRATLLSNGNAANVSGIKWYPAHPVSNAAYTKIGIHIDKNLGWTNQGIHTWPYTADHIRHGSICEL